MTGAILVCAAASLAVAVAADHVSSGKGILVAASLLFWVAMMMFVLIEREERNR